MVYLLGKVRLCASKSCTLAAEFELNTGAAKPQSLNGVVTITTALWYNLQLFPVCARALWSFLHNDVVSNQMANRILITVFKQSVKGQTLKIHIFIKHVNVIDLFFFYSLSRIGKGLGC